MIATVYGRFHYALDTLAGAGLAIAVVMAYRYLSSGGPGERQSGRDLENGHDLEAPHKCSTQRFISGEDIIRQPRAAYD